MKPTTLCQMSMGLTTAMYLHKEVTTHLITTTQKDGQLCAWPKIRQLQAYTWLVGTKTQHFMVSG
ncbi:hypothetical protein AOA73_24480 [Pseudomonas aeruginosa]|nr:hypothetical protein AOA73_24480 [Pseudomonas aeruginosa]KPE28238.1 hypothetical protein AOA75_26165 [Pseudomonas aeruginosa]